jgi:TolB-like protein/DNA-binding winged helix-turn-helix (wHTH) protein
MSLSSIPLPSELQPVVRFGLFEADLRAGELRKSGVKVKIQDLPFRALTFLLSRPNEVISREDFRQYLWPEDVFVDFDRGISSAIKRLRDALGDSPDNPIFIETIDRRGYRWIAPITSPTLAPAVQDRAPAAEPASREVTARDEIEFTARSRKRGSQVRLWLATAIFAVLGLAGFFLWRWQKSRPAPISSIAILPFDNLSAPSFDDAFSDGLTDEIAASISHLNGVRVAGRRSAYVFKGKHDDLRDIGSRLNVEAVVEGSVQRAADRTHVTVELNRTRDGFTIWSQTYDGTTNDWMQIESQIAGSIARALARKFSPVNATARDPEAHALYLEARYLWNQRNFPAELKSVDLLQQAIARDPNYALAWAALADSLIAIGDVEEVDPAGYLPRARDAALKALQLDPSLAEPHAALGMVACHYDYDWPTAEREYKKAFELNPNYASAHQYYALGLMAHGRFAEAEAQLDIARRLDPLALIVDVDLALLRKFQRDYDGVIAVSRSILERDPNYHLGYSMLTTGYFLERRWDDWRAADAKQHQDDFLSAMVNGHPDEIERAFRKLTDDGKAGARRPYDVGHYALLKGDHALALDWLEKSYQHHDYWMLFINVDPEYDAIRSDPRFQAIVHRLGVG